MPRLFRGDSLSYLNLRENILRLEDAAARAELFANFKTLLAILDNATTQEWIRKISEKTANTQTCTAALPRIVAEIPADFFEAEPFDFDTTFIPSEQDDPVEAESIAPDARPISSKQGKNNFEETIMNPLYINGPSI